MQLQYRNAQRLQRYLKNSFLNILKYFIVSGLKNKAIVCPF